MPTVYRYVTKEAGIANLANQMRYEVNMMSKYVQIYVYWDINMLKKSIKVQ